MGRLAGSTSSRSRRAKTLEASTSPESLDGGDNRYATAIAAELTREYQRRDRLDTRAATVVTSSTTISAALIALVVLVRGAHPTLSPWAVGGVASSAVVLASAWVLSTISSLPQRTGRTEHESLRKMLSERWRDSAASAEWNIASAQVKITGELRESNDSRTALLAWALWLQVTAVIMLAGTLVLSLLVPPA